MSLSVSPGRRQWVPYITGCLVISTLSFSGYVLSLPQFTQRTEIEVSSSSTSRASTVSIAELVFFKHVLDTGRKRESGMYNRAMRLKSTILYRKMCLQHESFWCLFNLLKTIVWVTCKILTPQGHGLKSSCSLKLSQLLLPQPILRSQDPAFSLLSFQLVSGMPPLRSTLLVAQQLSQCRLKQASWLLFLSTTSSLQS